MRKTYSWILALSALALISAVIYLFAPKKVNTPTAFNPLRIAHAGSGIDGKTYTNSYEALDDNIKRGFKYFELDKRGAISHALPPILERLEIDA